MAEDTDWATLKAKCAEHGCYLSFRCETFNKVEQRYSLSAITRSLPTRTICDVRYNSVGYTPQYCATTMVTQALDEWWPEPAGRVAAAE